MHAENWGLSTALGIFHPCGAHCRGSGSGRVASVETGVWEAPSLWVRQLRRIEPLKVTSRGGGVATTPLSAFLWPIISKVTSSSFLTEIKLSWFGQIGQNSVCCVRWLTIYELGRIPDDVLKRIRRSIHSFKSNFRLTHAPAHRTQPY